MVAKQRLENSLQFEVPESLAGNPSGRLSNHRRVHNAVGESPEFIAGPYALNYGDLPWCPRND